MSSAQMAQRLLRLIIQIASVIKRPKVCDDCCLIVVDEHEDLALPTLRTLRGESAHMSRMKVKSVFLLLQGLAELSLFTCARERTDSIIHVQPPKNRIPSLKAVVPSPTRSTPRAEQPPNCMYHKMQFNKGPRATHCLGQRSRHRFASAPDRDLQSADGTVILRLYGTKEAKDNRRWSTLPWNGQQQNGSAGSRSSSAFGAHELLSAGTTQSPHGLSLFL